jgi:hypothetical protein
VRKQQQLASSNNSKNTQPRWHAHHASRVQRLLDKQQIESPGTATDTVPSEERTSAHAMTTKNTMLGKIPLTARGTFFPVVLLDQFFGFWQEIGFGITYLGIQSTIQL